MKKICNVYFISDKIHVYLCRNGTIKFKFEDLLRVPPHQLYCKQIGCKGTSESSDLLERKRLRVADLGVGGGSGSGGGGRLWLLAMLARKVEQ